MPLLQLLREEIKTVKGVQSKPKGKPITLPLLKELKSALHLSSFSMYDQKMSWAVFAIATFGFLRVSEFCSPSQSLFDHRATLLVNDVPISSDVAVSLKMCPIPQRMQSTTCKSGKSVCPFRALRQHLFQCSDQNAPLF